MKRRLVRLGLALVALSAVWVSGGHLLASRRDQAARQAWADGGVSLDDFPARHPRTEDSPAARRLEELAVPLGIDLAPFVSADERPHPSAAAARKAHALFSTFATALDKAARDGEASMPAEWDAFYAEHRAEIEAAEAHLLSAAPLTWESNADALFAAPMPRFFEQRNLHLVFLLDAVTRARRADHDGAWRALEASHALNRAIAPRPELVSLLMRETIASMELGVLRRLDRVPADWEARIAELDAMKAVEESLAAEAWTMLEFAKRESFPALVPWLDIARADTLTDATAWATQPLTKPYLRLCAADHAEALRQMAVALRRSDPCTFDGTKLDEIAASVPRWNVMSRSLMPGSGTWSRLLQHGLEVEMTQRVLRLRALRAEAKDRRWPEELPDAAASRGCRAASWTYAVAADGSMTLALDRPLPTSRARESRRLAFTAPPGDR